MPAAHPNHGKRCPFSEMDTNTDAVRARSASFFPSSGIAPMGPFTGSIASVTDRTLLGAASRSTEVSPRPLVRRGRAPSVDGHTGGEADEIDRRAFRAHRRDGRHDAGRPPAVRTAPGDHRPRGGRAGATDRVVRMSDRDRSRNGSRRDTPADDRSIRRGWDHRPRPEAASADHERPPRHRRHHGRHTWIAMDFIFHNPSYANHPFRNILRCGGSSRPLSLHFRRPDGIRVRRASNPSGSRMLPASRPRPVETGLRPIAVRCRRGRIGRPALASAATRP